MSPATALRLPVCAQRRSWGRALADAGSLLQQEHPYGTLCVFSLLHFSPSNNQSPTVSAAERGKSEIYCGAGVSVFPKEELSLSGIQRVPFLTGTVPEDGIAVRRALISSATSHYGEGKNCGSEACQTESGWQEMSLPSYRTSRTVPLKYIMC